MSRRRQRGAYGLPQLLLVRFKLGLPGCDTACNHGGVLLVQRGLSLFLRPILPVCDTVLAAVQEVDLVKPLRWHISMTSDLK